jgi:flagellar protein FlbT
MALEIALKAQERMVVGGAVVRNTGRHTAHLVLETPAPVLREQDILPAKQADTPCRRIYLALQLLYLTPDRAAALQDMFVQLVADVRGAAPSLSPALEEISYLVATGETYRALRSAKSLIRQERELLAHVPA